MKTPIPEKIELKEEITLFQRKADNINAIADKINDIIAYLHSIQPKTEEKSYSDCCKADVLDYGVCKKCRRTCVEITPEGKEVGVDPTVQHHMKCPKLYGETCICGAEVTPPREEWEEEFEKLIFDYGYENFDENSYGNKSDETMFELKSFIRSLLSQTRTEERRKVREMVDSSGYGNAIYDILTSIDTLI